jgi:MoxR-like ATPase
MIELGLEPNRTEIVVKKLDGTKKNVGTQHKDFETILQCVSAKVNIALVGPAGSGKTTTVSQVAKALDLPFYSKSVSAQTGVHEFFGYQDANGNYVRTLFREAYENGGVFLLDEFDAGNPNVLASMNQATANGSCAFADGMVKKHDDFVVVMAGNTYGHGATQEYVGRNKIDSATLDRFAFINFDYDENMEFSLATNKDWCKEVQELRKKVADKKIKTIISPRATFEGEKMLMVGMPKEKVMELIIFKGMNEAERKLLS